MPGHHAIPWPLRCDVPSLSPGEIHVWFLAPPSDEERARSLETLLDPSERARASSFVFARHRAAFVSAHGQAREVLAGYLRTRPEALEFASVPGGKPRLADRCRANDLPVRFNLSHSGDVALLAVALDMEIGVDVEAAREVPTALDIARKHLATGVAAALEGLKGSALDAAFLAAWTRHEAVLKARGAGLFDAGRPGEGEWQVVQLDAGPTWVAAVAFATGTARVSSWTWAGPQEGA